MTNEPETTFIDFEGRSVRGKRWINPDGHLGGWVAETAKVDPNAVIDITAFVPPGAVVRAGDHIKGEKPAKITALRFAP